MFKLSKMTDYGVVVLGHLARDNITLSSGPEIAGATKLPTPTVAKILKLLVRADIVTSHRGSNGGYQLKRRPSDINLAEIIETLDSPVALTACVDGAEGDCTVETICPMRGRWDKLNSVVKAAIRSVSLEDIINYDPVPNFITMDQKRPSAVSGTRTDM